MVRQSVIIVTPLAGVWIEIARHADSTAVCIVTPLVGVWIEIHSHLSQPDQRRCHSPCGSVD